jgi:diguanylate cyclase (GGDEF)-like protein
MPSSPTDQDFYSRVLIAEDDLTSRRLLHTLLMKWGFDVVVASDGREAWEILQGDDPPRLVILDWMMPEKDGLEICRALRQHSNEDEPYSYVIMLTTKASIDEIVMGMEAGADDYITKPFSPHELRVRLRAGMRIIELQSRLIAAREAMRFEATHDFLTRVWNRLAIFEILQNELGRFQREGRPFSIILADLDHFKKVNDTYGHPVGDEVLRESIRRIKGSLRSYDSIGRYGGEEFLIVLPETDEKEIIGIAERLRTALSGRPIHILGNDIHLTMSLGVVTVHSQSGLDQLITEADSALYSAKHSGRDRAEFMVLQCGSAHQAWRMQQ